MMVSSFRGDDVMGGAEAKRILEEAAAGKGDIRLKSAVTLSKQKQQQQSRVVSIEEPKPHPPSILKRGRDHSASSSRPKSPAPTPKRRPTAGSPYRRAPLLGPQQLTPKSPATPKKRACQQPDPNSVRQQTKGMSQKERLRFKASRAAAVVTASNLQASAASPTLASKGVAQATLQTRGRETDRPLNLALPRPLPRSPPSVRPKEVGCLGRQPPVARSLGQRVANPPRPSIQSDFRYPPDSIGHSSKSAVFGGPAPLPPYPAVAQHPGLQPRASEVAPAAGSPAAPAPPDYDLRRQQLDALRQQEQEKAEGARKAAEEAEVQVRRLTDELAQAVPSPPAPLLATDWSTDVAFCNPHADDSLWQSTTSSTDTPQPTPPASGAVDWAAPPDEFVMSPDSRLLSMEIDELG